MHRERGHLLGELRAIGAGWLAFIGTTAIAQAAQIPLGINSGSRVMGLPLVPNGLGAVAVAAGSCAAVTASAHASSLHATVDRATLMGAALLGSAAFLALGGRFWALSPSGLSTLGAFSRMGGSLPATLAYATAAERAAIQRLGRKFGCHTCGARLLLSSGRFNADHMPPLYEVRMLNEALWRRVLCLPVKQRFYPQCTSCSSKQGVLLAKASRQATSKVCDAAVYHLPSPLRPFYAVGGLLAALHVHAPDALTTLHGTTRKVWQRTCGIDRARSDSHRR